MSSFRHTEIEYFRDNHDEERPLLSKEVREVLLRQKMHEPYVHDARWFYAVSYNMDNWRKPAHTLSHKTHEFFTIV